MEFSPEQAKAIRERVGLSRVKAAVAAGLSRQGLINIEDGESVPGADTLGRMASAYGSAIEDFYVVHDERDATAPTNGRKQAADTEAPAASSAKKTAATVR